MCSKIDIYVGIGLLDLKAAVMVERGSTLCPPPYAASSPSEMYSQNTDMNCAIGLMALRKVLMVERVGLLHILLNCIHKYTNIYNGIGLLAFKGVIVVERVGLFYIHLYFHLHPFLNCVHNDIGLLALKGIDVVQGV